MAASNVPKGFQVDVQSGGYAVVTVRSEPVNTLSLDLWRGLTSILDACEEDPAVRGIIFRSGLKKDIFSAGNDIRELYAPLTSAQRYREFWVTSNKFLARLYSTRLATVAAIRGACPAGGCAISLACDYRVMTEHGHIGLNEVALGISVPKFWAGLMGRVIGARTAERLCLNAELPDPRRALSLGLVDEVVPTAQLDAAAQKALASMLSAPDVGRAATKRMLREEYSAQWSAYCQTEWEYGWESLDSPAVTEALGKVMARLSSKKTSKL
ncbi:Enoyl-CoA delta isomerase 1, mitochondrial [Auxenochlorella protothecoides]|nr:Enoyl-CoA delta isomerase 1, mitochondrial [Auxenochlorella protothecoides]KFM23958.1 Enoyl-CoA delta isomerase 1, mitochondrial [Auxenochlorella protothecoides]RMZ54768.1 hypothetical protein APUTEX25_000285 [Auxenochlorella protothecoides]|eukprot:RMZ54768.1 hypothetical protein APUTEX25_000285 [Auxenochlorella protothecoides]